MLHKAICGRKLKISQSCPLLETKSWGAWVAQLVKRPTSAQVIISWFVSSSPKPGSVLTAQSLESDPDSVPPSLSAPTHSHSVSVSLKNKH